MMNIALEKHNMDIIIIKTCLKVENKKSYIKSHIESTLS